LFFLKRLLFLFLAVTLASAALSARGATAGSMGTTVRVSVSSASVEGDGHSSFASISGDGRFVAFDSYAGNLVAGDDPDDCVQNFEFVSCPDIFVHDRQTGTTEMVSLTTAGMPGHNINSGPTISADGRFVAFSSSGFTLVNGDTNLCDPPGGSAEEPCLDVFVRDRQTGTTERVSVSSSEEQSNGPSYSAEISADGRFVAFESMASNLVAGDTNTCQLDGDPELESCPDIFVRDRLMGTTERVSVSTGGGQSDTISTGPSISGDGRFVSFTYFGSNMVPSDGNGVPDGFVRDRQMGTTERVTVSDGEAEANGYSQAGRMSGDGRFVALWSEATNLVSGDTNGVVDAFIRDRLAGTTVRVSVSSAEAQGNALSSPGPVSADGRFIAFFSEASNLVSGDTNGVEDAFLRDLQMGTTERVSVGSGGVQANDFGAATDISADGRFVSLWSNASNMVPNDNNDRLDIFVHDRLGSVDTDSDGVPDPDDNCPMLSNADQGDSDGDERGNACDNCPDAPNFNQANSDGDPMGDACDPDDDNDTVLDASDNCPTVANTGGQEDDADGDFAGDACDAPGSGNVDCSALPGGVTSVDALKVMRHSAGLPVLQSEPCADIGAKIGGGNMQGDVNCSGGVNSVDALLILRVNAGLSVSLPGGCPAIKPP
jgi:Tol biopolymer transport system component